MNIYNPYEITFETQCYENDWEYILKTKYLDRMINNCNFNFSFRQLIINNVKNRKLVEYYAQKKIKQKKIDAYYFVDDYAEEVLNFFDIRLESFEFGLNYSAPLIGIYLAKTKYLLHFTTDAFMPVKDKNNWIQDACKIFEKDANIVAANPAWNFKFDEAMREAEGNMTGNFYLGYGFSDQCFLIRTDDFRAKIYNFTHLSSERYPKYAGESFEKRVYSYMRINNKQRITSTKASYIHKDFPRKKLQKKIILILMKINIYNFICILMCKRNIIKMCKRRLSKIIKDT